jgi:hypothetical protein
MTDKIGADCRWFQATLSTLTIGHANGALAASRQAHPNSFKAKPECQILVM